MSSLLSSSEKSARTAPYDRANRVTEIEAQHDLSNATAQDVWRYARDLTALLGVLSLWSEKKPLQIGDSLLDALHRLLNLAIAFASFEVPAGQNAFEVWRPKSDSMPPEIVELFTAIHDPTLA